ncbi:MAG TPA: helix-turn-helix transcriptional regulator [Candidatus Limnocylindria bacterium]|nr:helix-turn-helix transcriptional regulator [Candidatus Limnocylindria bacterium]
MNPRSVGKTVRWARKRAGMTQQDLAAAVQMPQSTIARIEAGAVTPMTATLMELLRATGHELTVEPILPPVDRDAVLRHVREGIAWRARTALGRRAKDPSKSPIRTVTRLQWFGVPFVLVGDVAEVAHGRIGPVGAAVEVCVQATPVAEERLARAIADLGEQGRSGRLRALTTTAAGDDYDSLSRNAARMTIDAGRTAPVASLPDLIRDRRARGAPDDLQAAAELVAILEDASSRPL